MFQEADEITSGTVEPWLTLDGRRYTREQCFAAYTKADRGEVLTQEEARIVGGWLVHPRLTMLGLAPFGIAALLLRRQIHGVEGELLTVLKDVTATAHNMANVAEDDDRHDTIPKYVADTRRAVDRARTMITASQTQPQGGAEGAALVAAVPSWIEAIRQWQGNDEGLDAAIELLDYLKLNLEMMVARLAGGPPPK